MLKIISIIAVVMLSLHGFIHLMGTVTYLKLGTVQGLTYKTTLLNGRWDIGQTGIAIFGILWGLAALGFVLSAVALLAGWTWAQPVLAGVALFSLALTVLDWNTAFAGAILNAIILAMLWFGPHLTGWISR